MGRRGDSLERHSVELGGKDFASVEAGVFAEVVEPHSALLQHAAGGGVGGGAVAAEFPRAERIVGEADHLPRSFGSVALPPTVAAEVVADFPNALLVRADAARADQQAVRLADKAEFQRRTSASASLSSHSRACSALV